MTGLEVSELTAKNGLLTRQKQAAVAGEDVTDSDRASYHRQNAVTGGNASLDEARRGELETDVHVEQVVRTYEQALKKNLIDAAGEDGASQAYAGHLAIIHEALAHKGEKSLTKAVQKFAEALQTVATEPQSGKKRISLLEHGNTLASSFNTQRENLIKIRNALGDSAENGNLPGRVAQINSLAEDVANLNKKISELETRRFNPRKANDMRNQRDGLTRQMARLADISLSEQPDKTCLIELDGQALVKGVSPAEKLEVALSGDSAAICWKESGETVTQARGETYGLLQAYNYTNRQISALCKYAAELADTLNAAHAEGVDLSGSAGGDLFDAGVPGNVRFLLDNPDRLAVSDIPGMEENGANARDIWNAMNARNPELRNNSLLDYPGRMEDSVATESAMADARAQGTAVSVRMFEEAITESNGVSIDTEMMKMLELQRAYGASARFLTVVDEMLSRFLDLT